MDTLEEPLMLAMIADIKDPERMTSRAIRTLASYPQDARSWYLLGHLLEAEGRPDEARRVYDVALTRPLPCTGPIPPTFLTAAIVRGVLGAADRTRHTPQIIATCWRLRIPLIEEARARLERGAPGARRLATELIHQTLRNAHLGDAQKLAALLPANDPARVLTELLGPRPPAADPAHPPTDAVVRRVRAMSAIAAGRDTEALALLEPAAGCLGEPRFQVLSMKPDAPGVTEWLARVRQQGPDGVAEYFWSDLADAIGSAHGGPKALALAQDLARAHPQHPGPWLAQALAAGRRRRVEESWRLAGEAVARDPGKRLDAAWLIEIAVRRCWEEFARNVAHPVSVELLDHAAARIRAPYAFRRIRLETFVYEMRKNNCAEAARFARALHEDDPAMPVWSVITALNARHDRSRPDEVHVAERTLSASRYAGANAGWLPQLEWELLGARTRIVDEATK